MDTDNSVVIGERGGKGRDGRGHTGDQWSWKSKIKIINMTPKEKKNPLQFLQIRTYRNIFKESNKI